MLIGHLLMEKTFFKTWDIKSHINIDQQDNIYGKVQNVLSSDWGQKGYKSLMVTAYATLQN